MDLRVFALVAVLAIGGVITVSATYSDAAFSEDTTDVEITVSHGEWIDLPGTDIRDETVKDADGGTLQEPDDYELRSGSGEIYFNASGTTTEGETVTANYTAYLPADLAKSWAGPLGSIIGLLGVFVVVMAVSIVLAALMSAKGRIGRGGL